MDNTVNIWHITLLLAAIAGFSDTATFVSADELFSAHVTGNFIVFAYDLVKGLHGGAWGKLLTFPVFVFSVSTGGWLAQKVSNRYILLLLEGLLLVVAGLAGLGLKWAGIADPCWSVYFVALLVVFAMGLQNAFGKIFARETHGPTTMMTGNVTQASLDLGQLLRTKFRDTETSISFKKQLATIGGFLVGCVAGALLSKAVGLASVLLPGLLLLMGYGIKGRHKPQLK